MKCYLVFIFIFLISSCATHTGRFPADIIDKLACNHLLNSLANTKISRKIKRSYQEISIDSLSVNKQKKGLYFMVDNKTYYGEVSKIKLFDDYELIQVKDEYGIIHLVDPQKSSPKMYKGVKIHLTKNNNFKHQTHIPKLDEERFLKAYCKNIKSVRSTRHYKEFKMIFSKYALKQAPISSRMKAFALCSIAIASSSTLFTDVDMGIRGDSIIAELYNSHGSNYVLGLSLMAIAHQCTSLLSPKHYDAFFKLAVGGNIAANIMYEIKFSDTFVPPVENNPVKTDLPDLISGMLGVYSYYLMSGIFKKIYNISDTNFCKRK